MKRTYRIHPADYAIGDSERLYERMAAQSGDVLDAIRTTGNLDKDNEEKLKAAIDSYTTDFLQMREG